MRKESQLSPPVVHALLKLLAKAKIIDRTDKAEWLLLRDPTTFTLLDLYRAYPFVLPDSISLAAFDDSPAQRRLNELLTEVDVDLARALSVPLRMFLVDDERSQVLHLDSGGQESTR